MSNKYSAEFKEQAVKRVLAGKSAAKVARNLGINVNSLYTWKPRYTEHPQQLFVGSEHLRDEDAEIRRILEEYRQVYGGHKITQELSNRMDKSVNHKRVERIMKENGICSKVTKKYKATTDSHHDLPVAPNILDRDFTAEKPAQKMVSDITYITTEEGWLYLAGVMDLCSQKIVGVSMDSLMTKELVINALENAINHSGNV